MKRIVLCCDGTWDSADQADDGGEPYPTNVVRLALRVAKRAANGVEQVVYYDQGVGTGNSIDRITGGAIGKGVEANIHDTYRFLIANYERGDELFLFGFSRGAFAARSIVGMVRKCGILAAKHAQHYREALELYRNEDGPDDAAPTKFRTQCCAYGNDGIEVRFIGVWDTVGALGIPVRGLPFLKKYEFRDTELSGMVKEGCHALAIDEHRRPFEPSLWDYKPKPSQHIEQVWFCGAHSDVGGGYAETELSDISLLWMIEKARGAGLVFDQAAIDASPLHPNPLGSIHKSTIGTYNVSPNFNRVIGRAKKDEGQAHDDPTQSLHPSVLERWDKDPSYRPKSLIDYFKLVGDPRVGSTVAKPPAPLEVTQPKAEVKEHAPKQRPTPKPASRRQYWLFQYAEGVRVERKFEASQPDDITEWKLTRYKSRMQVGDIVFYWRAGTKAGLKGWGEISGEAKPSDDEPFDRIPVRLKVIVREPIPRDEVRAVPEISDLWMVSGQVHNYLPCVWLGRA